MITFGLFSHAWQWPLPNSTDAPIGPPVAVVAGSFLPADAEELRPQYEGRHAAFGCDRSVILADNRHGQVLLVDEQGRAREFAELPGVQFVCASPDGLWIAASAKLNPLSQSYARVWNAIDGATVLQLPHCTRVAFSDDGKWLAAAGKELTLFRVGTWERVRTIPCPENRARLGCHVVFQPGGKLLAISDPIRAVRLVEVESGRVVATLPHAEPGYTSWLSFSPDGRLLAATREGFDVSIWDLAVLQQELAALGLRPAQFVFASAKEAATNAVSVRVDRGPLPSGSTWFEYWRTLAIHEADEGLWFDAIDNLNNALATVPIDNTSARAELLTMRGQSYLRNLDPMQARSDWQVATELDPASITAARYLAQLLVLGPPELRDASRVAPLMARLRAHDPSDKAALALAGVTLARQGRYAEAQGSLQRVKAGGEWEVVAAYGLAWTEHELGNRVAAAEQLERADALYGQEASGFEVDLLADVDRLRAEVKAVLGAEN